VFRRPFVAYRSLAPPLRCCLFALPLAFGALGFLLQILLTNQYFIDGIKKLLKSFVREKRKIYLCIKLPPLGGKY